MMKVAVGFPRQASGMPSIARAVSKSIVLAASMAFAYSAHAQSSVSIYGIIDEGITTANNGTTAGALLPGRGNADTVMLKAGNTSRLGFIGREDMGGGTYSRFQLETRFTTGTGALSNANVFWLGRSVVAVGGTWGEIYGGREYSPAYWVALNVDPTLWSYVSQTGSAYTYANYTAVSSTIEASNIRWANSVGYKSPDLKGTTFELATALGQGTRPRNDSGNLQYKQGPLWLAAGFDRLDSKNNLTLIGGSYDFGMVRPSASYSRAKGGLNGDANSYTVSALVPVSFGRWFLSYGALRPAVGANSAMLGGGIQYDLSKRTLIYSNFGSAKAEGFTRTTAFDLGVKHTF